MGLERKGETSWGLGKSREDSGRKEWGQAVLEAGEANKRLSPCCCSEWSSENWGPLGSVGAVKRAGSTHAGTQGNPEQRARRVEPGKRLAIEAAAMGRRRDPGCSQPHLCHLDHIGELSEAGDGDDIMVGPTLGPDRRKQCR